MAATVLPRCCHGAGIHIKGEDVSLFDTVNGKCIERTTFDSAPDSWQVPWQGGEKQVVITQ